MKVKLLTESASIQKGENGLVICSPKVFKIGGRRMFVLETGIQVQLPSGYVGIIKASRRYAKNGFLIHEIIDEFYREEIVLPIFNEGMSSRMIVSGEPIATLTIVPWRYESCEIAEKGK